jgi:restriction endonuclease S subunit
MLETDFIKPEVNYNHIIIDNFAIVGTGSTPSREVNEYFEGENNWVLTNEVAMNEISVTIEKLSNSAIQDYGLKIYPAGTILIAMYGQGKTRGQTALLNIPAAITQNCGAIVVDSQIAEPKYVWFFLMSIYDKIRGQDYSGGGVPHLNLSIVKQIRVPLPDIETQRLIVAELDAKMQVLNGLRNMKVEAEKKIKKILAQVWCVEFIETIKEEEEDE